MSTKFKELYSKLNPKQKEAVDCIEGPVMVIAGPGTGKTTILTLRIANILLKTDTPPSGILALTFTESGVKSIKNKLREVVGDTALDIGVYTFHGFASSVISEFDEHFPHLKNSRQITEIEVEKILREILKQKKFWKLRPLGEPDFYISKIIESISESKKEAWTPEMIVDFAKSKIEKMKNDPEAISTRGQSKGLLKAESLKEIEKCERTILLAEVYEMYEEIKKEQKKIDYDDLIFELLQTLRRDELLLRLLQEKYLYIMLDEHQDTNDTQNQIVKIMADFFETPNLFVVGDEKQAIYRFQGASVENFLEFQKIWSQMNVISLTDNYRSHQHILDATFKMIEKNYEEKEHQNLRVKLKSKNKEKIKPLDLVLASDVETEENFVLKKIKEILKNDKTANIAVIVRKNSEVTRLFSILEEAGIKASAERGADIFSHPAGYLYFSLLEFLNNPQNLEALAETFALGLWHLDFSKQVEFIKLAKSGHLTKIEKELPAINKLINSLNNASPLEMIYMSAEISEISKIIEKDPLSIEVWRTIILLAEDLIKTYDIQNPKDLIKRLLDHKKTAERKTIKISLGEIDSKIVVMTAHGSKGLEFDYVFLPYADEENWLRKKWGQYFILPKEKENQDDIRDERRLFYVALTRAKKHITISSHQTPVRFISEMDQKYINEINLNEKTKIKISRKYLETDKKQKKTYQEYTKRVLTESGLSVTALNHFLECPNKFLYKSILKLPEMPNANSEKGTAMHEAMANVWNLTKKDKSNEKQIAKIIADSVKNYFRNSFLPAHEKEAVSEELLVNAPKVAKALVNHFNQEGKIWTEKWFEVYFENLRLHGKLDVLIEKEKEVLVFDYKTTEAKSVANIKGETKNGKSDYFRQLVFYKKLLEENKKNAGKKIEPSLVFIKPDKKGNCPIISFSIEKSDIGKLNGEIKSLIKSVWSGDFLNQTCNDESCKYCKWRKI